MINWKLVELAEATGRQAECTAALAQNTHNQTSIQPRSHSAASWGSRRIVVVLASNNTETTLSYDHHRSVHRLCASSTVDFQSSFDWLPLPHIDIVQSLLTLEVAFDIKTVLPLPVVPLPGSGSLLCASMRTV